MKKLIPFLVLLASATLAMPQGQVNFRNTITFATTCTNSTSGFQDRLVRFSDGSLVTGSAIASPATYVAQLYYGANASSLQAHTSAPSRFSPTASGAGTWIGNDRILTGFAPGTTLTLQVVAWDMRTGATFEAATVRTSSRTFLYTIPLDPLSPPAAYFMEGLGGFVIPVIPEPAPILLLAAALPALWVVTRRRAHKRIVVNLQRSL